MPGGFHIPEGIVCDANSGCINPTTGSANSKGSWVQLIASAARDYSLLTIGCQDFTNAFEGLGVDIGIGASGSEQVIIPNLVGHSATAGGSGWQITLPFRIKAGTRIAARAQSSTASNSDFNIWLGGAGGGYAANGFAGVDALGFNTATSIGTAITPGSGTAKGSYGQIIASTARNYKAIFGLCDNQKHTCSFANYSVDIAVGASGSEKIIIPDSQIAAGSGQKCLMVPEIPLYGVSIPAGSRLAARCSDLNALGISIGVTLYGVY